MLVDILNFGTIPIPAYNEFILSGMANDYLYVSDISHDAFVNVDEIVN